MQLAEFVRTLEDIDKQVCYTAHPKLAGQLEFLIETENNVFTLELDDINIDQSWGCGCEIGATLRFKARSPKLQELIENLDEDFE